MSEDLAYWAGVIDSDGWIIIGRRHAKNRISPTHTVTLGVGQSKKREKMIHDIHNFFGMGHISRTKNGFSSWAASSDLALQCLQKIVPYLRYKKKQAELGIDFQLNRTPSRGGYGRGQCVPSEELNRREEIYRRMVELNA